MDLAQAAASAALGATASSKTSPEARKPKTDPPRTLTPEEKAIVALVEQRVDWMADNPSRDLLMRQMFEQIAFASGVQWLEYSHATKRFAKWQAPSWFPTPISNEIGPRIATMNARLLSIHPAGRARPKSNDPDDREAANLADKAVVHIYDVTHEPIVRQYAGLYASMTGTAIFKDTFNPNCGRRRSMPRTQLVERPAMRSVAKCVNEMCGIEDAPEAVGGACPLCGHDGMAATQIPRVFSDGSPALIVESEPVLDEAGEPMVDVFYEGELESSTRMLFNFYWDPKATRLVEASWCGEAVYLDLDTIDQMFPDLGPYVSEENAFDTSNHYLTSLISLVGASMQGSLSQGGGTASARGGAVLRWYEERPSTRHPKGLLAIVANGQLLHHGPLPIVDEQGEPTGDFSFTEFQYDLVPGRFAGRTPGEDMVPLQRRINGIDAQVILNRKTLINPWILAPKGSGLKPGQVLLRPGTTVVYNFVGIGAAPTVVQGTPLPEQVYKERTQCLETMDRLAQDPRISLSEMPEGVKSGIALNFLKEQGDQSSSPRLERWGICMAERDRKRLLLLQAYYREERAIRLFGQGSDWQVRYFKGADLRGNTDVTVDPATLLPQSRSARVREMFDAMEVGLLNPGDPVQRQVLLEELNLRAFDTEVGPDWRRANKENAEMDLGLPVQITEVDHDEVHLKIHTNREKDPTFDYLPEEAKMAHRAHREMHMERLLHRLAMQDAAGAVPTEAPSPGGGGPGPGAPGGPGGDSGASLATSRPSPDNPDQARMGAAA